MASPRHVIGVHLARLHEQIAMQARLAERLTALAQHLDEAEFVSVDDVCRIIEDMTTVRAAMETGIDPASPEILAIARQWKALVDEFTGNDPATADVATMYRNVGPALQESSASYQIRLCFSRSRNRLPR